MIYLAGPYSHPSLSVRRERTKLLTEACNLLMSRGEQVFSPVTLGHALWEQNPNLPTDAHSWEAYNFWFLDRCDSLVVLKLPGWRESVGTTREISRANRNMLPVTFMTLEELEDGSQK